MNLLCKGESSLQMVRLTVHASNTSLRATARSDARHVVLKAGAQTRLTSFGEGLVAQSTNRNRFSEV